MQWLSVKEKEPGQSRNSILNSIFMIRDELGISILQIVHTLITNFAV